MERQEGLRTGRSIKDILCLFMLAGTVIWYAGCITIAEKDPMFRNDPALREKTLARYQSVKNPKVTVREILLKDGRTCISITTDIMPHIQLYGSPPNRAGVFYLYSLYYLDSHLHGWNEFSLDIIGRGVFKVWKNYAKLELEPLIERLDISKGRILYAHSRLSGFQAIAALEHRHRRIIDLTRWMLNCPRIPDFKNQKAFERYWFPILFPELVSPRERLPLWKMEDAVWNRAGNVRWNKTYTDILLPPELKSLRNSGTLLRDWEEALGWIYLFYEWDTVVKALEDVYLTQKKLQGSSENPGWVSRASIYIRPGAVPPLPGISNPPEFPAAVSFRWT
jgi:hypothetical protein